MYKRDFLDTHIPKGTKSFRYWKNHINDPLFPLYSYKNFKKLKGEIKITSYYYDDICPCIGEFEVRLNFFDWKKALREAVKENQKKQKELIEKTQMEKRIAIAKSFEKKVLS